MKKYLLPILTIAIISPLGIAGAKTIMEAKGIVSKMSSSTSPFSHATSSIRALSKKADSKNLERKQNRASSTEERLQQRKALMESRLAEVKSRNQVQIDVRKAQNEARIATLTKGRENALHRSATSSNIRHASSTRPSNNQQSGNKGKSNNKLNQSGTVLNALSGSVDEIFNWFSKLFKK